MKSKIIIIFTLGTLFFIASCNNVKQEPIDGTNDTIVVKDNHYNENSASEDVAVLVFGPDGEMEYVSGSADSIYRKTSSGLEYKYITAGTGTTYPKVGDVVYFEMTYATASDSVVFRTSEIDPNFKMRIKAPSHAGGSLEEAFMMMRQGDSASFKVDAKNFLNYTQGKISIPYYVKDGDKFIFQLKMKKIVDGSTYVTENQDLYNYYIGQENSLIERYVLDIDFARKVTASGLNIFTISKGTGPIPVDGNAVVIDYTAGFIDGSVFDSTIEREQPFRFVLGNEEVIEGLEEAVKTMNVGDHCLVIIPFRIAYGEQKTGVVAPFSTLVFEIELLDAQ